MGLYIKCKMCCRQGGSAILIIRQDVLNSTGIYLYAMLHERATPRYLPSPTNVWSDPSTYSTESP